MAEELLIGTTSEGSENESGTGYIEGSAFVAKKTGTVGTIAFTLAESAGGTVELGIYSDDGTGKKPKALLGKGMTIVAATSTTTKVTVTLNSPVTVTSGTTYWLVYWSNARTDWHYTLSSAGKGFYRSGAEGLVGEITSWSALEGEGHFEGLAAARAVVVPTQSSELPIIYQFTSLMDPARTIAELPITGTTFSLVLNGSGPWAGSLNVEDTEVRKTNWREATAVNRSALWIAVEKPYLSGRELIYGGPTTGRDSTESTGSVALSGGDFYGYLAQRFPNPEPPGAEEEAGYTEYTDPEGHTWAVLAESPPAGVAERGAAAATIAYWLLHQALEELPNAPPITIIASSEPTPEEFWITFSAPRTQNQTLSTMLSQLHQLGYRVGVDIIQVVEYVAGVPTVSLGIFYPRRGGESNLVIASRLDLEYQEDGTQQSNGVVEMVGGTGEEAKERQWPQAFEEEYPLLSQVVSHASVSPTAQSARVLLAYEEGDLAVYSYPLTTPVVTLAMFGRPSILDLAEVGENVALRIDKTAGSVPKTNPRFPNGLDFTFRTVRLDATIPDQGLPTMKVTLNIPPSQTPIVPPE